MKKLACCLPLLVTGSSILLLVLLFFIRSLAPAPPMTLHEAAWIGNIERVNELLAKGADPNAYQGGFGKGSFHTPLRDAIYGFREPHHVEIVRALLEHGADPYEADRQLGIFHLMARRAQDSYQPTDEFDPFERFYSHCILMTGVLLEYIDLAKLSDGGRDFINFVSTTQGEPFLIDAIERQISNEVLDAAIAQFEGRHQQEFVKVLTRIRESRPESIKSDTI